MIKIALCDDSRVAVKGYAQDILHCAEKNGIPIQLSVFYSGEALLFHMMEHPNAVDIIYLDIVMNTIDGMQTAKKLRENECEAQIIFLTGSEEYVYDAFDVDAVQYLLKSKVTREKFEQVFLKAAELAAIQEKELLAIEFDGVRHAIPIRHISHLEIWNRVVTAHYGEGKSAKFYGTLEQAENRLPKSRFIRVHRSYIVHMPYIAQFHKQKLLLKTGESIPVGGTYAETLREAYAEYINCFHIYKL